MSYDCHNDKCLKSSTHPYARANEPRHSSARGADKCASKATKPQPPQTEFGRLYTNPKGSRVPMTGRNEATDQAWQKHIAFIAGEMGKPVDEMRKIMSHPDHISQQSAPQPPPPVSGRQYPPYVYQNQTVPQAAAAGFTHPTASAAPIETGRLQQPQAYQQRAFGSNMD